MWVVLWLATSLGLGCQGPGRGQAEGEPTTVSLEDLLPVRQEMNVIVISFDAMRADVLGTYGSQDPTSPAIDAFADESLVFDNAHTAAPVTPTSFASAFSGMLSTRVFHAWDFVAEKTLAGYMSEAGYYTAGVINSVQLTPERHFDRGFDEYDWSRNDPDDKVLAEATDWLYQNDRKPFMLWVHFLPPHAPYVYRKEAEHLYRKGYEGPFETTTGVKFDTDVPRDIERIKDLYKGMVLYSDHLFGELIATIEELGLLDNSLVIVTSDHGEELYEHGGFQHGRLTEEQVRIPLIIHHPDMKAGARTDVMVSNVDLLPTIMEMTGHPITDPMDGHSWLSGVHQPRSIVSVSLTGAHDRYLSLRRGDDKLILTCMPERGVRLYDLASDPGEENDLAETDPVTERQLLRRLGQILGGEPCSVMQDAVRGQSLIRGLSEKSVEALRALGYL